jgi:hypothetical protein
MTVKAVSRHRGSAQENALVLLRNGAQEPARRMQPIDFFDTTPMAQHLAPKAIPCQAKNIDFLKIFRQPRQMSYNLRPFSRKIPRSGAPYLIIHDRA